MIQYILAFFVFVFSTLASWYEGSEIRSNPWEWKYSAFFFTDAPWFHHQ
ncbi:MULTISPECIES: DUF4306 domain-containing protein [unclassified Anoxybacillus]|nr:MULTISPECIES: DUF4306 domain-containing protein [unclassified Anoxybacillus]